MTGPNERGATLRDRFGDAGVAAEGASRAATPVGTDTEEGCVVTWTVWGVVSVDVMQSASCANAL